MLSSTGTTPAISERRWLTRRQAADYLGVNPRTIDRAAKAGQLRVHRPSPRIVRYTVADLDDYMEQGAAGPRQTARLLQP
ncbi:MAG TPA: helix-turn-helix domain-containing protein [Candidatus Hydrogenedentes bacterium]|nr:helix-turn-helix domain-containing protein [Candidatus Hydrogenedentota bacterium]